MYDVIIVGAGPAGLNAALVLGRCRRNVLLCDDGRPRNASATHLHGFLSRDGIEPLRLRDLGREQLKRYPSVEIRDVKVIDVAAAQSGRFKVRMETGQAESARALLLATGVIDELPAIEGFDEMYGVSIHHCPYCDGWEERDKPIAAYGQSASACKLALTLRQWSQDIAVFTDGEPIPDEDMAEMAKWHIRVYTDKISRLVGIDGHLERVVLESDQEIERAAMFFTTMQIKRQRLPEKIGCEITEKGAIATDKLGETRVRRVFCAGDNTEAPQLAIVAAAEGAKAAVEINKQLTAEDLEQKPTA